MLGCFFSMPTTRNSFAAVCVPLPLVLKLLRDGERIYSEVQSELGEELPVVPLCASKENKRGTEQNFASLYSEVILSK